MIKGFGLAESVDLEREGRDDRLSSCFARAPTTGDHAVHGHIHPPPPTTHDANGYQPRAIVCAALITTSLPSLVPGCQRLPKQRAHCRLHRERAETASHVREGRFDGFIASVSRRIVLQPS
ncbi:hypothetical protein PVAR5_1129 [Paecilomyces variotii No. 5]|uniref:Uncharacterized protein n=1 Tax=Byssochlamys spectabilis (strain No. 5 / NBRC 109023) TaxID=1356009 RepID=V5FS80_BYSSN|nr:hypothetical protein PVAR5_1129 [Paecilomyces variotii No. 5]